MHVYLLIVTALRLRSKLCGPPIRWLWKWPAGHKKSEEKLRKLLVTRVARLAQLTRDLLNTLASIAAVGASFRSLDRGWRQDGRALKLDAFQKCEQLRSLNAVESPRVICHSHKVHRSTIERLAT